MSYFHIEDPYSQISQCAILYKELAKSSDYDGLFKSLMCQYSYESTYDPDGVDAIRLEISLCLVKFLQKKFSERELQLVLAEYPFLAFPPNKIVPYGVTDNIMKAIIDSSTPTNEREISPSTDSVNNEVSSEDSIYYSISVLKSITEENVMTLPVPCVKGRETSSSDLGDTSNQNFGFAEDYELTSVKCPENDGTPLYYSFEKAGVIPPLRIVGPTGVKIKHYLRSILYHRDRNRLELKMISSNVRQILIKYSYPCDYVFKKEDFISSRDIDRILTSTTAIPSTAKEKLVPTAKAIPVTESSSLAEIQRGGGVKPPCSGPSSKKRGKTKAPVTPRKSQRIVQQNSPMNPEDDSRSSEFSDDQ